MASGAIAISNVLLPALIKMEFSRRAGLMMGLYMTVLTGSATAAAGLTVPLGNEIGEGWRGALAAWALPAACAIFVWLPWAKKARNPAPKLSKLKTGSLARDKTAWMVTVYFGLQSLGFYAILAWLPSLYHDYGYSLGVAGVLLSISTLIQVPVTLIVPVVASRVRAQHSLVLLSSSLVAIGLLGILLSPTTLPIAWMLLLGAGQGMSIAIALTMLVVRARTSDVTTRLSAMAQSWGYLVAALGPLFVGVLHSTTGTWRFPVAMLLILLLPQTVAGWHAGAPRYVFDARPSRKTFAGPVSV